VGVVDAVCERERERSDASSVFAVHIEEAVVVVDNMVVAAAQEDAVDS